MTDPRLPTYFLSHGGGPWPWMKAGAGSTFDQLEASLQQVRREIGSPRAILVISGHDWLDETLAHVDPVERERRLLHWTAAPAARAAHPREDHLMPLLVAAGAAGGEAGARIYHEEAFMGGVALSSFRFGAPLAAGRSP